MLQYMKVFSVFDLIDEAHVLLSHVKVIYYSMYNDLQKGLFGITEKVVRV
jgi:hypothetical protein